MNVSTVVVCVYIYMYVQWNLHNFWVLMFWWWVLLIWIWRFPDFQLYWNHRGCCSRYVWHRGRMSVWLREYGTQNFSDVPLVLVVSWVKCWSSGMSTRSCRTRYVMTDRDLALRSARVSHPRVGRISVTMHSPGVVAADNSGISTLGSFQLLDVRLAVWIPHSGCIFEDWS